MSLTLDQAEQIFDAAQELAGSAFDFMSCQGNRALIPTVLQRVNTLRDTLKGVGLDGFDKPESGEPVQAVDATSQRNAILKMIQSNGALTTLEARACGIMHPAMRVLELRRLGHNIVTHQSTQYDGAGVCHRVAVYVLEGGLT